MHGGNQPLALLFCDGQGNIEGKGELFSILLPGFISGRHQSAHLRRHSTDPELVFEFLFSLVEPFEEVLISHLDLVWPGPDLPGARAHNRGFFSKACQDSV